MLSDAGFAWLGLVAKAPAQRILAFWDDTLSLFSRSFPASCMSVVTVTASV